MKNSLSKKQKKNMTRILISLVAFLIVVITDKIVDLAKVTDSNLVASLLSLLCDLCGDRLRRALQSRAQHTARTGL